MSRRLLAAVLALLTSTVAILVCGSAAAAPNGHPRPPASAVRIPRVRAQLPPAPLRRAPGTPATAGFGWPLDAMPLVVRRFDPPPQPWLAGHRGVDLAARPGATVRAAGAGTVVFAGRIAGRGVVSVAHRGGLRTTYEPVDVDVPLRVGRPVTAGAPLGRLTAGHPGCVASACLHWGLRDSVRYLDPLALLGLGRVRLLPMRPGRACSPADCRS